MVHFGIIPDGNRRWCKRTATSLSELGRRHLSSLIDVVSGFAGLCSEHPDTIGEVREVSVYLLSIDNTRRSDGTLEMVQTVLEGALVIGHALAIFRSADAVSVCVCVVPPPGEGDPGGDPTGEVRVAFSRKMLERVIGLDSRLALDASAIRMIAELLRVAIRPTAEFSQAVRGSPLEEVLSQQQQQQQQQQDLVVYRLDVFEDEDEDATLRVSAATRGALAGVERTIEMLRRVPHADVRFFGVDACLPARMRAVRDAIASIFGRPTAAVSSITVNVALGYDPIEDTRSYLRDPDRRTPIDLVLRTSGEVRTSGFFPMQTLYSEWGFVESLFPDLTVSDVARELARYKTRERRFGK